MVKFVGIYSYCNCPCFVLDCFVLDCHFLLALGPLLHAPGLVPRGALLLDVDGRVEITEGPFAASDAVACKALPGVVNGGARGGVVLPGQGRDGVAHQAVAGRVRRRRRALCREGVAPDSPRSLDDPLNLGVDAASEVLAVRARRGVCHADVAVPRGFHPLARDGDAQILQRAYCLGQQSVALI